MVRKLLSLVILLAVLSGLDLLASNVAEKDVADQVRANSPVNSSVQADIPTFPFVPRLLISGSVPKVVVHLRNVAGPPIRIDAIDITITGVTISRSALLHHRHVELVSIDKGTVSVDLSPDALSDVLHTPVQIVNGQLTAQVNGTTVTLTPSISKNELRLSGAGAAALPAIGLGQNNIIPCLAAVVIVNNKVHLSCTVNQIPPAMVAAANKS